MAKKKQSENGKGALTGPTLVPDTIVRDLRPTEEHPVGTDVSVGDSDAGMLVSVAAEMQDLQTELGVLTFEFEQRKATLVAHLLKTQGKFADLSIEVGKKLNIPVGRGSQDWMFLMGSQSFRRTR